MNDERESTHRREFVVRALAMGSATVGVAAARTALADEPKKDDPPPPKTEVDVRMDLILTRYGKHLDEDGKKAVRAEMESIVRRAETLRKFVLTNGDEPYPVFKPYRAPL